MHTLSTTSRHSYPRGAAAGSLELDLALDPGDEQEQLFGSIARKISRAATGTVRKVGKTVAKTAKASRPVWKTVGRAAKSAHRLATPPGVIPLARFGRDLARGKNVWHSFRRAGRGVVNDVRAKLRYARIAAPFVPGVGTGVAAALGAADALASGRSITDAAIAAARSAIPGGALAQTAFDVGLNLAQGRSLSAAALDAARRRLPGGPAARAAFDTAVALGRGKSLQAAARRGARGMRFYRDPSLFFHRSINNTNWRTRMRTMHGRARELEDPDGLELDIEIPDEESLFSKTTRFRPIAPGTNIPPYTQCDFIHPNIDVSAQYALYGMLKADAVSRNASVQMLAAVKTGRLGGIYQEDQKVPALRAIKLGLGWYGPLIEKYRKSAPSAACVPPAAHPSHKLEIISFKKSLAKNLGELGRQLRDVWLECAASKLRIPPVSPLGTSCPKQPKSSPCKTQNLYQYLSICDTKNADCLKQLWTYANGDLRFPIYCWESPECRNRCRAQRQKCQQDARSQSKCPLQNDPSPPLSGGFEFETSRQSPSIALTARQHGGGNAYTIRNGWTDEDLELDPNMANMCRIGEGPPAAVPDPEGKGPHPLVYRGVTRKRSRNPAVGHAQILLNKFLASLVAGDFACKPGANLNRVMQLRSSLKQSPLNVDCRFGPDTEKATLMFQHCSFPNDPKQWDGKIGPNTWRELQLLDRPKTRTPPSIFPSCASAFLPSRNGFRFGNTIGLGLCGGMAFLAADYYHYNLPIPTQSDSPSLTSSLYYKIWNRQIEAVAGSNNGPKFLEWTSLPNFGKRSCTSRTYSELENILAYLCDGRLYKTIPIGLVIADSTMEIEKNHQVLVYAATQDSPSLYRLKIYDPNYPMRDDVVLEAHVFYSSDFSAAHVISNEFIPGRGQKPVRGFFQLIYQPKRP